MQSKFNKWIDTFLQEKGIDLEQTIEIEGPSGTNVMPIAVVVDAIKTTGAGEKSAIKTMIVKIDFVNGDVVDYFKHLGQAIAL